MSKMMLSTPGLVSALAFKIACAQLPGPLSLVLVTTNVETLALLLVIVSVAELIAPSVAPPQRLAECQVDRRRTGRPIGVIQDRDREAFLGGTDGKCERARDARVILTGDRRTVRRGVTHRDGHIQIAGPQRPR